MEVVRTAQHTRIANRSIIAVSKAAPGVPGRRRTSLLLQKLHTLRPPRLALGAGTNSAGANMPDSKAMGALLLLVSTLEGFTAQMWSQPAAEPNWWGAEPSAEPAGGCAHPEEWGRLYMFNDCNSERSCTSAGGEWSMWYSGYWGCSYPGMAPSAEPAAELHGWGVEPTMEPAGGCAHPEWGDQWMFFDCISERSCTSAGGEWSTWYTGETGCTSWGMAPVAEPAAEPNWWGAEPSAEPAGGCAHPEEWGRLYMFNDCNSERSCTSAGGEWSMWYSGYWGCSYPGMAPSAEPAAELHGWGAEPSAVRSRTGWCTCLHSHSDSSNC